MSWTVSHHGAVAVLTFSRPPDNTMDMASMEELERLLGAIGEAPDTTVVMLTGGVDGVFVAHADLEDLRCLSRGEAASGRPGAWGRALSLLESMPQPAIAAIDGQAWGGGCEIALACTLRIGSERAHLAQPEVTIGIIPGAGGTQRLPRLVGAGRGAELCLSGRIVRAEEAHRIGLLNAVLPTPGFIHEAVAWAGRIAAHPRDAVFAVKRAIVDGLQLPLAEGLRVEGQQFSPTLFSAEARTRMAAVPRSRLGP